MPSAFSWPVLVPYALRAPAPVNLGVRFSYGSSLQTMKRWTIREQFAPTQPSDHTLKELAENSNGRPEQNPSATEQSSDQYDFKKERQIIRLKEFLEVAAIYFILILLAVSLLVMSLDGLVEKNVIIRTRCGGSLHYTNISAQLFGISCICASLACAIPVVLHILGKSTELCVAILLYGPLVAFAILMLANVFLVFG